MRNSNTTLVKVKYVEAEKALLGAIYSNTTLVKVKCGTANPVILNNGLFKYNTC